MSIPQIRSLPGEAPGPAASHHARVVATDGERYGVVTACGRWWVKVAASCLVAPQLGDTVLISVGAADGYLLAVLERAGAGALTLRVDGDLAIELPSGELTVRAARGVALDAGTAFALRADHARAALGCAEFAIDTLDITGGSARSVWQSATSIATEHLAISARSETRTGQSVRRVSGHDETTAGSMRVRADHHLDLQGARASLTAEQRVTIDAAQVQLG